MAIENSLRYLKTDFQSHKDALLQRVRARYPGVWNDFLTNSFGIVLVDIVAWSTTVLAFIINRGAGENFVGTMTLRESAVRIGTLPGYRLHNPVPSTVLCEALLTSPTEADVTLQKGTQVRTASIDALPFETLKDFTIEAGDLTPRVLVVVLSPEQSGAQVINSYVQVTNGSTAVDIIDSTIDLSKFISVGQTFQKRGDTTTYGIQSLETTPGAVSNFTRIVLDSAYTGVTEATTADVYEQRIELVQGQTVDDRFVVPPGNNPDFAAKLTRFPVIDGSVRLTVDGVPWEEVSPSTVREADAKVFWVQTFVAGADQTFGQTVVRFGDDVFGASAPGEAVIEVTYRVGGGLDGNVALNDISTSITGIISSLSSPVPITLTNRTASGIGGRDQESLEEARVNIPFFVRTNDRAVTLDDYQTLAAQFVHPEHGSVAYARASTRPENSFLEGNNVVLYAWTTGTDGGLVPLSSALKLALMDYLQTKAVATDLVQIYDGTARPVPASLRFKTFSGFSIVDTRRLVLGTLKASIIALRPGQPLLFSNLVRALDEAQGVDTLNIATPIADLNTSNSTELFTAPQDNYTYAIARSGSGSPVTDGDGNSVSLYTASLPIYPLAAWSLRLFLGLPELSIVPYVSSGFAKLSGTSLSADDAYPSTVNLLTGKASLWIKGAPGDLTMKLNTVQGYSAERTVNVYVGYTGDNTMTKRREIRSNLRAWSEQLAVGQTVYGERVTGISASSVSVADVVKAVTGVTSVTRVALDHPSNPEVRLTSADYELIKFGNIVLNNAVDALVALLIPAATLVATAWKATMFMC